MPTNMAFHDLTPEKSAPPDAQSLLGLGSKFISTPPKTTGSLNSTFTRFERDFIIKVIYAVEECEDTEMAFADFDADRRPKLYVKSKWNPTVCDVPYWVSQRLSRFQVQVQRLFRERNATPNLLPSQQQLLDTLPSHPLYLFPEADKGLGPCAVTYDQYVEDCLKHLRTKGVYRQLSAEEANASAEQLRKDILTWLTEYKRVIGNMSHDFIKNHIDDTASNPFGQFYVMYKVHKGKNDDGSWPTRPVCSDVSSVPHGLGKWVAEELNPLAQLQESYFKDSFALKSILDEMVLPHNALVFTSDAVSMYTNIKTGPALFEISSYIQSDEVSKNPRRKKALIEALHLVFENNLFKLGDTFWKQESGTAMGTYHQLRRGRRSSSPHMKRNYSKSGKITLAFINDLLTTSLACGSWIQTLWTTQRNGPNFALT